MRSSSTESMILACAAIAWQIYAVLAAFRRAPILRDLLEGLGAVPPNLTRVFLATYPYWPIVPVAFTVLVFRARNRERVPLAITIGAIALALVLHAWMNEAWFLPILSLMERLG
jgi:hypothetical protein